MKKFQTGWPIFQDPERVGVGHDRTISLNQGYLF